jgi:ribose transport system permease protein
MQVKAADVPPSAPAAAEPPAKARGLLRRAMGHPSLGAHNVRLLAVTIAVALVFFALKHTFLSGTSIRNLFVSAVPVLLLGIGETFVLISGGIDLSVGSMLACGGMVAGELMSSLYSGTGSAWLLTVGGLVAALLVGAAGGMLNGWTIARLRLNSLIVTLGAMGVLSGVAALITGGNPISTFPGASFRLGNGLWGPIPIQLALVAVVYVLYGFIGSQTRFGRYIYALGANREALRRAGVNVSGVLVGLFAMSGLAAALAGFLAVAQFQTASPSAGANDLLLAVAAVVIGGTPLSGGEGSIVGTAIGAMLISILENGFVIINVQAYWQLVAVGIVTVGAVYLGERDRFARVLQAGQR